MKTNDLIRLLSLAAIWSGSFIYIKVLAPVLGPVKAATVPMIMPAFGLVWGVIFLKEVITAQMIIGCFLIIAGLILVLFKKNNESLKPSHRQ